MTKRLNPNNIDLVNLRTELFKRGDFDFITIRPGKGKHIKQELALQILIDSITEEFAYGGAAGGAKSWTGASWLVFMCWAYADTKWFIGREELTRLKSSTYITLQKVLKKYGFKQNVHWEYKYQDHYVLFSNGSRIDLLDLKFLPRDPYYERYGSVEYTGGWIEEAGEINVGAFDTLKTRIGRHNNEKYGILGKILITLNPKKNWVYSYFWKPFKEGLLPASIKFLQAFVQDNLFVDSGYENKLKAIKDKTRRARLLLGDFDYEDDENSLMNYDSIIDLFTNSFAQKGKRYITADIARFGKDTSTIYEWDGWHVLRRHVLKKNSVTDVANFISVLMKNGHVPASQVIVDEDGVGGGVMDILKCKGFVNNSSPLENPTSHEKQNYENLKTQCSYMAASCVNERIIYFSEAVNTDEEFKTKFQEEAEQVKKRDPDSDGKLKIIQKETVKELLGRSPDDWDCFMMRQWFELKPKREFVVY